MGMGRTTTAVLGCALMVALTACGKQGCSDLPVNSGIQLQIPPAIQKLAKNLRIELCQGSNCKAVNFPSSTKDPDGEVATGISLDADAYDIDLDRLGTDWKPDTISGLTIIGTAKSGRVVLQRTEQFTFTAAYPNGQDCDDHASLTYSTSVGGADLVG